MSHYRVAVFHHGNPEELLRRYSETDESYFVFEPVDEADVMKRFAKFHENNPNWTYEMFARDMYHTDDSGAIGYWYNPNAKYDYYTDIFLEDLFILKDDAEEDEARYRKSQIDFDANPFLKPDEVLRNEWKLYSEEGDGFYSEKYYLRNYGTEEQYIREMKRPMRPYAFVTPDGEWHAPGDVGYFGTSSDNWETREKYWQEWQDFIHNEDDCYVELYDMHI